MKIQIISLLALAALPCRAQRVWTARQCMQYAVEHNHEVVQSQLELDNLKASRTAAIGRFLPSVDGSIGVQYNFGRAIDPATNGYTDVSTFYNGYSLSASVPVFDGLSRLHALRAANASVLMGREALRQQQDATALNALRAFVDVAYNEGMVGMAEEKLEEARLMLRQTRMLEEVGRKSAADVALMESQEAEANYELTNCLGCVGAEECDGLPFYRQPHYSSDGCPCDRRTAITERKSDGRDSGKRRTEGGAISHAGAPT